MMISKDSPLRRLPQDLERRQALFLDGIRYSAEIAELAYKRLARVLLDASSNRNENADGVAAIYVSALLDAWCVVDSIYRLRRLLHQVPKHKKSDAAYQAFVRRTASADGMRNITQHLETEIPKLEKLNISAWGSLSWGFVEDAKKGIFQSCAFIPGMMMQEKNYNTINPLGMKFSATVDQVTLFASDCSINLSESMRAVESYVTGISNSLAKQIDATAPIAVSDVFFTATIKASDEIAQ